MNQQLQINSLLRYYDPLTADRLRSAGAKRRIAGLPSGTGMKGSVELIYDAVTKNEYLYFNQYGLYRSNTDAADQDFAKLVKASGSEYTKIATAGNFGDLRRNVLLTGETVYMASENSAAVNSDLKLPAVGSLGAAAGQASYLPSQPFRTVGASGQGYTRSLGRKVYELTDHLGNVHATVSDRRIYDATLKASLPEVKSLADYYPFGMQMPGKKLNPDGYRYGFNGKEHETGFGSDSYDFGARVYNSLTGTFGTIDPKWNSSPELSTYIFAGNSPIRYIDFKGEFKVDPELARRYPKVAEYIQNNIQGDMAKDYIKNEFINTMGLSSADYDLMIKPGEGPMISIGEFPPGLNGEYIHNNNQIKINEKLFEFYQTSHNDGLDLSSKQAYLFVIYKKIVHESSHYAAWKANVELIGDEDIGGNGVENKIFNVQGDFGIYQLDENILIENPLYDPESFDVDKAFYLYDKDLIKSFGQESIKALESSGGGKETVAPTVK